MAEQPSREPKVIGVGTGGAVGGPAGALIGGPVGAVIGAGLSSWLPS
jgi:outer membrane lipoprotein SlyB